MGDTNRVENTDRYANIQTEGKPEMLRRRRASEVSANAGRPAERTPSMNDGAPARHTVSPEGQPVRARHAAGAHTASARPAGASPAPRHASTAPQARHAASAHKGNALSGIGAKINSGIDALLAPKPHRGGKGGANRGPDWQMILAVAVMAIILIGILALCVIGIKNCASGCAVNTNVAQGNAIIYKETDNPNADNPGAETQPEKETPSENQAVDSVGTVGTVGTVSANGLRSARIRSIGDFVIHNNLIDQAKRLAASTGVDYSYNFAPMLNPIRAVMENADLTVANVDGSMGGEKYYKYGYQGYPQFNTPPYLLYALKDAGVDMLTLANNHMLDGWFDGLMAEIENVEKVGLYHVGANRSTEEKESPTIVEINGIKVGFMNYTESLNSMETRGVDPNALVFGVNATRNSDVAKDASTLRNAGADVIVCYMHWGTEYEDIDANQGIYGRQLVQAGVDVIIGGHPHVVQPAKWLTGTNQFGETQKTLCLYSLGNFLSDQRTAPRDGGIIFDFTIQEQYDGSFEIINPSYLPTWVWRTGNDITGYSYQVLPIAQYMNKRPEGMNDEDYNKMVASYQNSVSVMNTGVGSCITE